MKSFISNKRLFNTLLVIVTYGYSNISFGGINERNVNQSSIVLAANILPKAYRDKTYPSVERNEKVLRFQPTEDAYLERDFGRNTDNLQVKDGQDVAYLKFDVKNIDGVVSGVKLKVHITNAGKGMIKAYRGVGNNWSEGDLTASSAPIKGGLIGSRNGKWKSGKSYLLDIGSLLSDNGEISLLLEMDEGGDGIAFASLESDFPPELIVTFKR
ncbi:DUF7594 domain-containing protein [Agarilytica rhodophyticola]|uniref:CBM96 family carbohydrate-binding protein n=1 Tax=Agarilytica rhodophyticola TaxID=1737490 RepID=UPI000B349F61|nr:DNRLRE domain-containing protein [Agarilytica rhodophyticola]